MAAQARHGGRSRTHGGWSSRLGEWIGARGVRETAAALGVTQGAVYQWIHGETIPAPDQALRLVDLSERELSLEAIYSGGRS